MTTQTAEIVNIRRPKILLQAAQICARGYKRETMLPRMLGASPARVVDVLRRREAGLEAERKAHAGSYSPRTHVEVLSALIAECQNAA